MGRAGRLLGLANHVIVLRDDLAIGHRLIVVDAAVGNAASSAA